jgi:hypothetical protein
MNFLKSHTGLLVFAITLAVWLPSLRNDFVDWDDLNMIVHNPRFNPPTPAGAGWYWTHRAWNLYQPLTTTLWAVLARIGWVEVPDHFGGHMNPAVFHLAGVLLHALGACILFQILFIAARDRWAAAIGALLFAVHPIQTEAVVFAGVLNNPLAGSLSLLAIWQYLVSTEPAIAIAQSRWRWALASVALLLAMLAKPTAIVTAPMALVLDLAIHRRSLRRSIRSILPWIFLVLPCMIWTRLLQHGADAARSPLWFRPMVAGDAVAFYLRKIFLPVSLAIDYGRTPAFVHEHGSAWLTLLVPIAMLLIAGLCIRRAPLLSAALLVFLIGLLPNSGLLPFDFQQFSTVADRYVYFSMIGVGLAAVVPVKIKPMLRTIGIAFLLVLSVLSEIQVTCWQDGQTLFRHALAVNPDSWMSAGNLAVAIGDRSCDEAIALCRQSIAIRSDQPDVWNTLGSLLMERGDRPQAISAFETAHRLAPDVSLFGQNLARARNAGG